MERRDSGHDHERRRRELAEELVDIVKSDTVEKEWLDAVERIARRPEFATLLQDPLWQAKWLKVAHRVTEIHRMNVFTAQEFDELLEMLEKLEDGDA